MSIISGELSRKLVPPVINNTTPYKPLDFYSGLFETNEAFDHLPPIIGQSTQKSNKYVVPASNIDAVAYFINYVTESKINDKKGHNFYTVTELRNIAKNLGIQYKSTFLKLAFVEAINTWIESNRTKIEDTTKKMHKK